MGAFYLIFCFNVVLLFSFLGEAKINAAKSESDGVYIVYMGALRKDHAQLVSQLMKRKKESVVHTYGSSFSGFAARLSEEEAKSIAQRPEVVSVFRDPILQHHTTRSWDFLESQNARFKLYSNPTSSHSISWSTGADTIIGIFDSGIWPEHPSFSDKYMGPIPTRWKGTCMRSGNHTYSIKCNRKVIGARHYNDPKAKGKMGIWDEDGQGTHVASTAAGIPIWGASYKGLAKGMARGGSPGSRIAVYGVCGEHGCPGSSLLKAYDDAIADGVDVISLSLGDKHRDFLTDTVAIGAFHAVEKEITVVCSVGNGGPSRGTVENFAPWILSVGATTIDRAFVADIVLVGNRVIKGGGINNSSLNKSPVYHLVDGRSASSNQTDVSDAINCAPGSLDGAKIRGNIVLCEKNDEHSLIDKINTLKKQGVAGIIMIDGFLRQLTFDYGTTPFVVVTEEDGAQIRSYINSTRKPLATILPTVVIPNNYKPAPVVPFFSARGPPTYINENLIKPDVAAPGVDILAAIPPLYGEEGVLFRLKSGTSMSCPHVSGLAAIVKSHHPDWSPSAIRSAIMTTATQTNNQHAPITTDNGSIATPYDIGAGEISLFGPLCPGLVYETSPATDYVQFLCNMGYNTTVIKIIAPIVPSNFSCPSNSGRDLVSDMNYPSISVSRLKANALRIVKRTVTNVAEDYSTYTATVEAPAGMEVQVVPKILQFTKNVKKLTFQVTFKLTTTSKQDMFGSITWSSGQYKVRSPFVVSNALRRKDGISN